MGSAGTIAVIVAVTPARKSSYRSACTTNRLAALQDCPLLSIRASTAAETAPSRSSVDSRMNGSDPPSSSATFFRCRPATSATAVPARSDPVSETPATRGSPMIAAAWSLLA